ncbi:MAG: UDP-N-acetylmuramoyl-L-alanine--D-glutamate ligase [Pseudomonadota bacterium]|nr:UDP-N-acetylmuramoyl-L-alanine--D-glutamate ligase [Pseudomonadota bacterium]
MIDVRKYSGRNVGVLGLGATGISAVESLTGSGAYVSAWDDSSQRCRLATGRGFSIVNFGQEGVGHLHFLLVSPGIPLVYPKPHPVIELARQEGVQIISDVELLQEACPTANYIGVTGTNGKSTVTALLAHLIRKGGKVAEVGGNFGSPVLGLEMLGSDGTYVLELSSYQLDLARNVFFDIAIWTNLSPDHLERHGSLDGYICAKKNIFKGSGGFAVVGVDDKISQDVFHELVSRNDRVVVPVSVERSVKRGISVVNGILYDTMDSLPGFVMDVTKLAELPGSHNWHNIAIAYAAARLMGLSRDAVSGSVSSYTGLPHRMEKVGLINGVTYINDSKATNMVAAAKALACYDKIYWIMGGRAKEIAIGEVDELLSRVLRIYTIGESGAEFEKSFRERLHVRNSGTLVKAFSDATKDVMSDGDDGGVVLLSPACASFDQFENFEARGEAFRKLVAKLQRSQEPGGRVAGIGAL